MGRDKRPEAGVVYHRQLLDEIKAGNDRAYRWLRNRGFRNGTITDWRLGYVEAPLRGHEAYRGMLVIPYKDAIGRERGLRFRRLDDGRPKYMSLHNTAPHLFGVKYTAEPVVYVTEGEIDCMTLHQMGFKAVGVPGSGVWLPEWKWLFRGSDEVVLVPDADGKSEVGPDGRLVLSGGQQFRMVVSSSLKGIPANVRIVSLPEGEDVNSMYLSNRRLLHQLLRGR